MSLAFSLRRHGAQVLVVERGEPGREASHAAAGMLADLDPHTPEALRPLALASARLYPEFVRDVQEPRRDLLRHVVRAPLRRTRPNRSTS